ncbi:MAG: hypothetical protein LBI45_01500 [Bacteroidales bacterium]|jgi:hypothetical protein|nr:hypothetical protein [Bacteroidales bacterium]
MNIKKTVLFLLSCFFPFFAISQESNSSKSWSYKGYSGGMFVHTGYMQSKKFSVFDIKNNEIEMQIKGATFGLGGKMGVFLHRNFRVGAEGYFSTCKYNSGKYMNQLITEKGSCRIGWGGVTFDLLFPVKKFAPFMGVTIGGGSAKHLIFIERKHNNHVATPIVHFSNPLIIINPAIGAEFFATKRISLLLKLDYMFNVQQNKLPSLTNNTYPRGVRLYFGIHFYHKK